MVFRTLMAWAVMGLLISGCSTTATIESMFDATSSSTGSTWWTEDGLVNKSQHAELFVALNHEHLFQDIAKGEGEYLRAFGHILNVPAAHQKTFATRLQENFLDLSEIKVNEGGLHLATFMDQVAFATKSPLLPRL